MWLYLRVRFHCCMYADGSLRVAGDKPIRCIEVRLDEMRVFLLTVPSAITTSSHDTERPRTTHAGRLAVSSEMHGAGGQSESVCLLVLCCLCELLSDSLCRTTA